MILLCEGIKLCMKKGGGVSASRCERYIILDYNDDDILLHCYLKYYFTKPKYQEKRED